MKLNHLLSIATALTATGAFIGASYTSEPARSYTPRKAAYYAASANGAINYQFNMRKNPLTGMMDYEAMVRAQQEVMQNNAAVANLAKKNGNGAVASATLNWKELGPGNVGGRTRALLIDKNNPNRIFAGGVAGGLWISNDKAATWTKWSGSDQLANMAVTCLAQAPNGDIYFGTGEGTYYLLGTGSGGIVGGGMWRSTDGGNTFNVIPSTVPTANQSGTPWAAINSIGIDPFNSNKIYAATNYGLRLSTNGGLSWSHPIRLINGNPNTQNTTDIEVGTDGVVFAAVNSKAYKSNNGDSATFTNISTGGTDKLPSNASGRLEMAISPTDPNYVYATATTNQFLSGVYQSVDKGVNWKLIGPGGSSQFSPFGANGQADYDNMLGVDPANKGRVILGGVELWSWTQNTATSYGQGQWSQIAAEFGFNPQYYVHADKHVIKWDPTNPNICYIGCDGGIFRSQDMTLPTPTYAAMNNMYNVTQCYSIAYEPTNVSPAGSGIIFGTQDNGTQYVNGYPNGGNTMWANAIGGGDGGECEISQINPSAFFGSIYYGNVERSSNKGSSSSGFFSSKMTKLTNFGNAGFASFVTPMALYENTNATNSPDSVDFTADQNYAANAVVGVLSKTNNQWFGHTLTSALTQGQKIRVQDIIQSKIVVGFSGANGVWMTKKAIDFSVTPTWFRVAGANTSGRQISGTVESLAWSGDGNYLFIGTDNGALYRVSNMAAIVDSLTGDIGDNSVANNQCITTQALIRNFGSGRYVTGISVDPTNPDNVAVTIANYGYTDYVYYSTNATQTTPTFTAKNGIAGTKLPSMPLYGVIIEKTNPKRVIVASEFGVWKTDDITATTSTIVWTQENANGMANVPTFAIRQQRLEPWHQVWVGTNSFPITNSGRIYVGTHGRGAFACDNYYTPASMTGIGSKAEVKVSLGLFPNPTQGNSTVSFTLAKAAEVTITVFDLNGKVVKTTRMGRMQEGANTAELDNTDLGAGTYLLSLDAEGQRSNTRFVIAK